MESHKVQIQTLGGIIPVGAAVSLCNPRIGVDGPSLVVGHASRNYNHRIGLMSSIDTNFHVWELINIGYRNLFIYFFLLLLLLFFFLLKYRRVKEIMFKAIGYFIEVFFTPSVTFSHGSSPPPNCPTSIVSDAK